MKLQCAEEISSRIFFPQSLKEIGIPYTEVLYKYNPDCIISVQK